VCRRCDATDRPGYCYARREAKIDRIILAGFRAWIVDCEVGETLLAMLGREISAIALSPVAKGAA
jgi:hypothetical protein